MTAGDDLFGLADRLLAWLPGALGWLPAGLPGYLVVPVVVVVLLVTPRVVVHRVLPWIGHYLVVPAVAVVSAVVVTVTLAVDVLLARLFRLFSLPLTAAHHAIGDWAITGGRGVRGAARLRVGQLGWWLAGFNSTLLMLAGAAVVFFWNRGYCAREPAVGCADPVSTWWHATLAVLPEIRVPWA
ncbi:hypothetical protein AB0F81_29055 [Actinoplanes sp. NPDC024001]|uniref:hypothetical protein n=1 Tax=Actinoplanes sp. NPDC024001 TaxID=3154598 RepID=UPI0033F32C0A